MRKLTSILLTLAFVIGMMSTATLYASADLIDPGDNDHITDKEDEFDDTIAQDVIDLIAALPDKIDSLDKTEDIADVKAARKAYDKLTPAQQAFVDNLAKLEGLEDDIAALENAKLDKEAADAVTKLINELGEITDIKQADDVEAARNAYEKLTDAQKNFITEDTLKVLEAAEKAIADLLNPPKPDYDLGDVDKNESIDINDLSALKVAVMEGDNSEEILALGDMDASGTIDVNDMTALKATIMAQ